MLTVNEIIRLATFDLNNAISSLPGGTSKIFTVVHGDSMLGEPSENDPYTTIEYDIFMEYGNIKHRHAIVIGWNEIDGVGFDHGEDGDIDPITPFSLFKYLYFDLALTDLDEEFAL